MKMSRTLITEHNAHGKSDQEIVLCEKKLEMYSPSRRVVTKVAESKRVVHNLLNNTTLCANWSLPWGVLRS